MIRKYFIYITIIVALLIACYYRETFEDSIGQKVKNIRNASPFVDDRIESQIENAMGR